MDDSKVSIWLWFVIGVTVANLIWVFLLLPDLETGSIGAES